MSDVTAQQVEAWILQSNDPASTNQTAAVQILGEFVATEWSPPILFQLLQQSQHIHVRFFALTTLGRINDTVARGHLRSYLLQLPESLPNFMVNKAASILSLGMIKDGGTHWSTLDRDLLQLAHSNPSLYLQTIKALMDDFYHVSSIAYDNEPAMGSLSTDDTRRFKEVLKGYHDNNSKTLLETLFETVVGLLDRSISNSRADQQLLGLQTIAGFLRWTEIRYLGSAVPRVLEILLFFIDPSKSNDLQKASLESWQEFITSSSIINSNVSSIQTLDNQKLPILKALMERLHATNLLPYSCQTEDIDGETMEVVIRMAAVVNAAGLEILPLYENQRTIETLFNEILDLFFRSFAYDDIDVASAVIPLALKLIDYMDESSSKAIDLRQHLPLMLNKLYQQMLYPDDFGFDYENEDDAEEEMFRKELGKVYSKLVRVAPSTCLRFVAEAASTHLSGATAANVKTSDAEASLRLLYHYSESVRPAPGLSVVLKNDEFVKIVVQLHNSTITHHPHREVLCLYYETAVRYCQIFLKTSYTQLLEPLLDAMTGKAGLQHDHPRVRSRCCYLLLKLVKATMKLLRPYVLTAVNGIQTLISNPTLELRAEDTLFLFETIGLLLGHTDLPDADQGQYLRAIIAPHAQSIDAVLKMPGIQNDPQYYGTVLSSSIAAVTYLSKGFAKPVDEVKIVLTETLPITLAVLEAMPNSEDVRSKCMVLLQRMIQCVDKNIYGFVPKFLHVLIVNCTADDILFVSQLFNQICSKFKDEAVPLLDTSLVPFLQKCQTLSDELEDKTGNIPPHLRTEQLSIRKNCYLTIQYIVSKGATALLFTPTNHRAFDKILALMQDGAVNTSDPAVRRSCLRFFQEACDQLHDETFLGFICNSLVPKTYHSILSGLDPNDANQSRVVAEFSSLLWKLKEKHSLAYQRSLENLQLTQLPLTTAKEMEKYFVQVINATRNTANS